MTIREIKQISYLLHKSVVAFVTSPHKVENVKCSLIDFAPLEIDKAEDFGLLYKPETNELFLPIGTQCTLYFSSRFEDNEAEICFNMCSSVVASDDDFLSIWDFHLHELEEKGYKVDISKGYSV